MIENLSSYLPLSPAALHILLALAPEPRHGYGIMQDIARQSAGQYKLGPGTLYDNLRKLTEQALVEEAATKSQDDDPRRRYYQLTGFGRKVLRAEVTRLEQLLREAKLSLRPARGKA